MVIVEEMDTFHALNAMEKAASIAVSVMGTDIKHVRTVMERAALIMLKQKLLIRESVQHVRVQERQEKHVKNVMVRVELR